MWWESTSGLDGWLTAGDLPSPSIVIWIVTIALVLRFLNILSSAEVPQVTMLAKDADNVMRSIIDGIPMLKEPYRPPPLWGRSGHVQTAAYGLLGHASLRRTFDRREAIRLPDGTTATFDVFEPLVKAARDITLCLTPGIANSSESNYIRTCVHYAQEKGYRCAVLNHLGALADVKLTGGIEEISTMMSYLFERYAESKFINIGFSMGGNVTTQYLLKMPAEFKPRILLGLSVGQGYSATVSAPMYHDWENGRRAYNYIITENMKRLLRRNYDQAVAPHVASGLIDEQRLWAATSIIAFDEQYNRRVAGYSTLDEFYRWCDCLPKLNDLDIPMVFLNAEDDPIVPRQLWEPVKELCSKRSSVCFISTRHGGHLGFLEGGSLSPRPVTWLDRFIIELAGSAVDSLA